MPGYTDRDIRRKRKSDRERQQKWRAAKRTGEQSVAVVEASAALPVGTEASAVAEWAAAVLKVPPGHPKAGEPMVLPDYGLAFLSDVFRPSVREISLVIARKNSKSALVAVLLLAHLAGPVRKMGFRAGVVSLTAVKAGELKTQAQEIAEASGLTGVEFLRSPAPGRVVSPFGSVDVLSSDSDAGAAAGIAADRFRQSELQEALSGARLPWPTTYRSSLADHLPIFQRRVYGGEIRVKPSLLLLNAIADSEVQRDGHRARLVPARRRSRIDPLVAAIHAVSLAAESYRTESEVDALMAV